MTFRPHILLQAGGPFFDSEIWSINLRCTIGGTVTDPNEVTLDLWEDWTRDNVEDLYNDVAAYVTDATAAWSTAARLQYVKANVIGADGRYRNQNETVAYYNDATTLPDGTQPAGPAQTAVAVSLLTDAQRGRGSRGRYFVPVGALSVDGATGRVSSPVVSDMANAAATFLGNLNNTPGIDVNNFRVIVASELGNPGPQREVTSIAVGNVLDTQRRRRNSLPETYTTRPVVI